MQAPDFWDNMEKAQSYVKELNTLKNILDDYNKAEDIRVKEKDIDTKLKIAKENKNRHDSKK